MSFSILKKKIESPEKKDLWAEESNYLRYSWTPKVKLPQLEELIKVFQNEEVAIAGGAILGVWQALDFGDIDVFPLNKPAIDKARAELVNLGYKLEEEQPHCEFFRHSAASCRQLQLIKAHVDVEGDVGKMLDRFDLSCVQVAVYRKKLYVNSIARKDIKNRLLRCTGTLAIASLVKRIEKYKQRGFRIEDE